MEQEIKEKKKEEKEAVLFHTHAFSYHHTQERTELDYCCCFIS
jgi:hypothetical protein